MAAGESKMHFDLQRRVVSHVTSSSWKTVPHVSFVYEPDVTEFIKAYQALSANAFEHEYKLTLNTVILKIISEGLKKAPSLNAFVDYDPHKGEGSLIRKSEINIAVPWLLPDGRMNTPTVLDCGNKSVRQISADVAEIKRKIANTDIDELLFSTIRNDTLNEIRKFNVGIIRRIIAGKITKRPLKGLRGIERKRYYGIPGGDRLTKDDLLSATISVSNIGSLYKNLRGYFSMLQIIPPQVFAVGINALQERPLAYANSNDAQNVAVRKCLPLTLVFDHRAVDFSALIPFIKECDAIFADPERVRNL